MKFKKRPSQIFTESILIKGTLIVTITPINAFLNPNNLIVPPPEENSTATSTTQATPLHEATKQEFIKMISQALENERETNQFYEALYKDLEPETLVEELMFYVNAPGRYALNNSDTIQRPYLENNIQPKHGHLSSLDELYLLQGWNDALIDLVKDRLSVHSTCTIILNEITDTQLLFLFPDITEDQQNRFFQKRDGDSENNISPSPFRDSNDLKILLLTNSMLQTTQAIVIVLTN